MEKIIENLSKFNEHTVVVPSIRLLAQSFIDKGVHPSDFNNGKVKNELIIEYNRRKILQIKELISKMNNVELIRIKNFLKLSVSKRDILYKHISNLSFHKLDKLYEFSLDVSNKEIKLKNPKSNTEKIRIKIGQNRKTRKKGRR